MTASPPVVKRTAGAAANAEIAALLRSRHTLLWIVSREELRVERGLIEAAGIAKMKVRTWDVGEGFRELDGKVVQKEQRPSLAVEAVEKDKDYARTLVVFRDLPRFLGAGPTGGDPVLLRRLRNAARTLQTVPVDEARAIVILSPSGDVPAELADHCAVLEYPLPDRAEIQLIVNDTVAGLKEDLRATALPAELVNQAVDAAVGLTAEEASSCYAKSLVSSRRIDPAIVSSEKRRVIAREKVLTWYEPDPRGLESIGGLDALKDWLRVRHAAFAPEARAFGLPAPKGVMLVGIPGTGKSLTAKCIAAAWKMPLLRLDMGGLRSKWLGESEGNIRKALRVAEAVAPCVLWLDEIEKALAGSGGSGDGGVAADALGTILSWMQERVGAVFVVATANDVAALPPELLRKGRFDEMFFVDLPTPNERREILKAALMQYGGRTLPDRDLADAAAAMQDFTGAEIAACVPDALFVAFADKARPLTAADLIAAARQVVPLAKSAAAKIQALRDWSSGRCRPASSGDRGAAPGTRELDLP